MFNRNLITFILIIMRLSLLAMAFALGKFSHLIRLNSIFTFILLSTIGAIVLMSISGVKCAIIMAPAALPVISTTMVVDAALAGGGTIIAAEVSSILGITGVAAGSLANLGAGIGVFTTTLTGE